MLPPSARLTFWRVAAVLALGINLWFMYAPRVPGPGGGLRLDLLGHAATFAALTFTALMARVSPRVVLPLVALNAVSSELVQHWFLPNRTGDWTDLAADVTGIAIAWAIWTARSRRPPPPTPTATTAEHDGSDR